MATFREREMITAALPAYLRSIRVGCVELYILVSNNGRYAEVDPAFLTLKGPCGRDVFNGIWFLRKTTSRWKVIFAGSDPPSCRLGIPRDLVTGCLH